MEILIIVGKCRLNEILKSKKMTQTELAIKVNMKRQQISAYANNDREMSLKTAANIAYQLDVAIEDLYDFVLSREQ
ncbi:helix-turn-helix transcriptional regulator [Bacillus sp. JJ722]|uniref:helix-turn-helix transcriptional regulator n=1 Tax=Bacillus sp. JJ722 TaxID=3122973 RepID=UPI002FFF4304